MHEDHEFIAVGRMDPQVPAKRRVYITGIDRGVHGVDFNRGWDGVGESFWDEDVSSGSDENDHE